VGREVARQLIRTAVIGIDCATEPRKTGLALGFREECATWLEAAEVGQSEAMLLDTLTGWLGTAERVLLSIDAPLGWPSGMAAALPSHQAGAPLGGGAHALFRRATDRFIRRRLGKQSLDVGADRIARTAFAALSVLHEIRKRGSLPIPLAWDRKFDGVVAIEVYPAATLRAHGMPDKGYKVPGGQSQRMAVIDRLGQHFDLRGHRSQLLSNVDVLDAAICMLAGLDFEGGAAMPPENIYEARREGWIWARDPALRCSCIPVP